MTGDCKNCGNIGCAAFDSDWTKEDDGIVCYGFIPKAKTRFDSIKSMSVEELAQLLADIQIGTVNSTFNALCDYFNLTDRDGFEKIVRDGKAGMVVEYLNWLKSPADKEEEG